MKTRPELLTRSGKANIVLKHFLNNLRENDLHYENNKITQCVFLGVLKLKPVPSVFSSNKLSAKEHFTTETKLKRKKKRSLSTTNNIYSKNNINKVISGKVSKKNTQKIKASIKKNPPRKSNIIKVFKMNKSSEENNLNISETSANIGEFKSACNMQAMNTHMQFNPVQNLFDKLKEQLDKSQDNSKFENEEQQFLNSFMSDKANNKVSLMVANKKATLLKNKPIVCEINPSSSESSLLADEHTKISHFNSESSDRIKELFAENNPTDDIIIIEPDTSPAKQKERTSPRFRKISIMEGDKSKKYKNKSASTSQDKSLNSLQNVSKAGTSHEEGVLNDIVFMGCTNKLETVTSQCDLKLKEKLSVSDMNNTSLTHPTSSNLSTDFSDNQICSKTTYHLSTEEDKEVPSFSSINQKSNQELVNAGLTVGENFKQNSTKPKRNRILPAPIPSIYLQTPRLLRSELSQKSTKKSAENAPRSKTLLKLQKSDNDIIVTSNQSQSSKTKTNYKTSTDLPASKGHQVEKNNDKEDIIFVSEQIKSPNPGDKPSLKLIIRQKKKNPNLSSTEIVYDIDTNNESHSVTEGNQVININIDIDSITTALHNKTLKQTPQVYKSSDDITIIEHEDDSHSRNPNKTSTSTKETSSFTKESDVNKLLLDLTDDDVMEIPAKGNLTNKGSMDTISPKISTNLPTKEDVIPLCTTPNDVTTIMDVVQNEIEDNGSPETEGISDSVKGDIGKLGSRLLRSHFVPKNLNCEISTENTNALKQQDIVIKNERVQENDCGIITTDKSSRNSSIVHDELVNVPFSESDVKGGDGKMVTSPQSLRLNNKLPVQDIDEPSQICDEVDNGLSDDTPRDEKWDEIQLDENELSSDILDNKTVTLNLVKTPVDNANDSSTNTNELEIVALKTDASTKLQNDGQKIRGSIENKINSEGFSDKDKQNSPRVLRSNVSKQNKEVNLRHNEHILETLNNTLEQTQNSECPVVKLNISSNEKINTEPLISNKQQIDRISEGTSSLSEMKNTRNRPSLPRSVKKQSKSLNDANSEANSVNGDENNKEAKNKDSEKCSKVEGEIVSGVSDVIIISNKRNTKKINSSDNKQLKSQIEKTTLDSQYDKKSNGMGLNEDLLSVQTKFLVASTKANKKTIKKRNITVIPRLKKRVTLAENATTSLNSEQVDKKTSLIADTVQIPTVLQSEEDGLNDINNVNKIKKTSTNTKEYTKKVRKTKNNAVIKIKLGKKRIIKSQPLKVPRIGEKKKEKSPSVISKKIIHEKTAKTGATLRASKITKYFKTVDSKSADISEIKGENKTKTSANKDKSKKEDPGIKKALTKKVKKKSVQNSQSNFENNVESSSGIFEYSEILHQEEPTQKNTKKTPMKNRRLQQNHSNMIKEKHSKESSLSANAVKIDGCQQIMKKSNDAISNNQDNSTVDKAIQTDFLIESSVNDIQIIKDLKKSKAVAEVPKVAKQKSRKNTNIDKVRKNKISSVKPVKRNKQMKTGNSLDSLQIAEIVNSIQAIEITESNNIDNESKSTHEPSNKEQSSQEKDKSWIDMAPVPKKKRGRPKRICNEKEKLDSSKETSINQTLKRKHTELTVTQLKTPLKSKLYDDVPKKVRKLASSTPKINIDSSVPTLDDTNYVPAENLPSKNDITVFDFEEDESQEPIQFRCKTKDKSENKANEENTFVGNNNMRSNVKKPSTIKSPKDQTTILEMFKKVTEKQKRALAKPLLEASDDTPSQKPSEEIPQPDLEANSDVRENYETVKNTSQMLPPPNRSVKNDEYEEYAEDSDDDSRAEWMPEEYAEYKYKYTAKKLNPLIYKCKICLTIFPSYHKLMKHKKTHMDAANPYECRLCADTFKIVEDLVAHLKIHRGERPYKCTKCSEGFWTKNEYDAHRPIHILRKIKDAPKKYQCDLCGKAFVKLCDMDRHTRVHTGEKPSICNICGKGFQQSYNLSKHLITHLHIKPHTCEICNRQFSRPDVLERHILTHAVEKPFKCTMCPKNFIRQIQLNHHLKAEHSVIVPKQPVGKDQQASVNISQNVVNMKPVESTIEDASELETGGSVPDISTSSDNAVSCAEKSSLTPTVVPKKDMKKRGRSTLKNQRSSLKNEPPTETPNVAEVIKTEKSIEGVAKKRRRKNTKIETADIYDLSVTGDADASITEEDMTLKITGETVKKRGRSKLKKVIKSEPQNE